MTDRPIIFSSPMVLALLDGRKTQTRRLATSPLRKCQAGDRLYVRESGNWQTMTEVAPVQGRPRGAVWYAANSDPSGLSFFGGKQRPSIHMPRWASRLTLIVESVRIEPLQAIASADAVAEGVERYAPVSGTWGWRDYENELNPLFSARESYASLWTKLHGRESWAANPDVVVLTFKPIAGNIDQLAS